MRQVPFNSIATAPVARISNPVIRLLALPDGAFGGIGLIGSLSIVAVLCGAYPETTPVCAILTSAVGIEVCFFSALTLWARWSQRVRDPER